MTTTDPSTPRPRSGVLTALGLVVIYVLLAAGLGNLLSGLVRDDQEAAQFALGHLIPLPLGIALLLVYVRRTENAAEVWRERPTPTLTPHRWYLIAIPVIIVAQYVIAATEIPWAERTIGIIALVSVGTLMVGLGEELAVRGVLLTAVRQRHGEFATLLVTSLVFALAHIPGSIIEGDSLALLAFKMFGLLIGGAGYYWVRRVSGRLWVGALVHAFSDWALYLSMDDVVPSASMPQAHAFADTVTGYVGIVLWVFLAIGVISVLREDHRNRKRRQLEHDTVAPETDR